MRMRLATYIIAGVVAAVGIAAPMTAVAQSAEEIIVDSFNLKDADMIMATQALTAKTGLRFVVEPGDNPFPKVTLSLVKVSAEQALAYLCQAAGASFRRDANGVYIISRGRQAEPVANPIATPDPKKPLIAKKFKMQKADAKDVYSMIRFGKGFDATETYGLLQREVLRQVNFNGGLRGVGTGPILMGGPSVSPATSNQITRDGLDRARDITLPGETAGQGGLGAGGGGGQGGIGGGQGGQGGGGGATLQAGQGLVGQSIDYISYDPTDNSIIVRGTEEDIAELQRYISLFDVAPRQVIIKVEFITTSSSLSRSLGFDWLYERGTVFAGNRPGSFARAGDPIFLSYATGNVTARMRALLQSGNGRVVNAPVVRTLNNQPASVGSNIATTIFINQVVGVGNGQTIIAPQPQQLNFTSALAVTPRINEDGTVTAFIGVQITDLGQLRRGPDGQEIPDQLSQFISVVARVKAGETIALGGFTRKSETGSAARFPVLGDLPIIGQFFRSSNREVSNSELIVFVTPTVVEDDGSGGLGP